MKRVRSKGEQRLVSSRVSERRRTQGTKTSARTGKSGQVSTRTAGTRMGKQQTNKKKRKNPIWPKIWIAVFACLFVGIVTVIAIGAGMYASVSKEMDALDFEGIAYNFTSIVYAYDENGNSMEVEYLHNNGNREWIENDKIPQVAKDAAVAIEDERFFTHKGIDFKRTTGAIAGWFGAMITGGDPSYGGSTITQQVIKNITQEKDKTVNRKIKEMMRAIAFEKRFTKEEILAAYLNISYFGNQCYGIEAASKMYFSKPAIELTLPEAAMIVGITQAPTKFDPFKNPENTLNKRNTVLMKMHELGKISKEEYENAINSPLGVNENRVKLEGEVYNYFIDQVINDVIEDLQEERGYSYDFAVNQVFGGGVKIYTTMDSNVQAAMEEVYKDPANFTGGANGVQSAMVIIDPKTGEIKGMVGGIGEKTESRGLNRATQSKRQPGSSIKPISVYGPALENGVITAATILEDKELVVAEKNNWAPQNYDRTFTGDVTVRHAIKKSLNVPAVRTLMALGVDESYKFMTEGLGFTTLAGADKDLSPLSLGGLTKGVSPKEMAAAYVVFANKGVYMRPYTYTKVEDRTGKVLLENKPSSRRVMSEENAYIMSSFLKDVVNGGGTGGRARLSRVVAYGKTGTSSDNKDKWFCGFTPHYVGATWYGYDDNRASVTDSTANIVWAKVMEKVHANIPGDKLVKEIAKPDRVEVVTICELTGKQISNGCTHGKAEYFVRGTVPYEKCENQHWQEGEENNGEGENTGENGEPIENPNVEPTPSPEPSETPTPSDQPENPVPSDEPEIQEPTEEPEDDVIVIG